MGLFFQSCKDYVVSTLICPHSKQELLSVNPCPESTVMSPPPGSVHRLHQVCLSVCLFSQKQSFHIKVGEVWRKLSRYPGRENPIFLIVSYSHLLSLCSELELRLFRDLLIPSSRNPAGMELLLFTIHTQGRRNQKSPSGNNPNNRFKPKCFGG